LKFNEEDSEYFLSTSWCKEHANYNQSKQKIKNYLNKEDNYYNCKPTCLIVPLDRKIKVSYEEIIDKIKIIKFLLSEYLNTNFRWDIFLIKSNVYKEQIIEKIRQKENLNNLLYTSLPQYIWIAQAYDKKYSEEPIFDFIFDSIEMPYDGRPFIVNIYSESFKINLCNFDIEIQNIFDNNFNNSIYKILVEEKPFLIKDDDTINNLHSNISDKTIINNNLDLGSTKLNKIANNTT
jgi:hypothetical protein